MSKALGEKDFEYIKRYALEEENLRFISLRSALDLSGYVTALKYDSHYKPILIIRKRTQVS